VGTVIAARGVRGRGDPLALAGWQMAVGGGVLVVVGALVEGVPGGGLREAALVAGLAIFGSAAPLGLFYLALAQGPAAEISAWFFLVPVVGVLSAWPLLGEEPTMRLWAGLAAVSIGLWMVLGARASRVGRLVDSAAPP
jgi:drug/metabolite transporter (DMT)-like permease